MIEIELGTIECIELKRLIKNELNNLDRLSNELSNYDNGYEGLKNSVDKDIKMYKELLEKLGD